MHWSHVSQRLRAVETEMFDQSECHGIDFLEGRLGANSHTHFRFIWLWVITNHPKKRVDEHVTKD